MVFSLNTPSFVHAFNAHQPFDLSADVIDYVEDTQEITARGHVVIVQSSSTLNADEARYDRLHKHLIARGKVVLTESNNIMLGDQLDYDLVAEKGVVMGGKGYSSTWFFQGTSWEKNRDYYVGRNAAFTSCDLIDPHYHIRSSRVHLIPDRLFWSWNNVFYADDLPVLYTPFMYKYLDKQRVTFQAQPGSDSLNGTFAKTTTTMRFTDHAYDKLYYDYYTVAGIGLGNEFNFDRPGKDKGSLFGYYINPHPDSQLPQAPTGPQYAFRGNLWQSLSPTVQAQGNVNLRQNISFNTQYFAQDPNQSQTNITSALAITHQTKTFNQHIVVDRTDAPDTLNPGPFAATHMQSANLPSYAFTLYQRPLWSPQQPAAPTGTLYTTLTPGATNVIPAIGPLTQDQSTGIRTFGPLTPEGLAVTRKPLFFPEPRKIGPILFSMTGAASSVYQRLDERLHSGGGTTMNLTESFPFARNWTYNTGIAPQINFQDRGALTGVSTDTQKGYTGRMTFSNGMRWRPVSSLSIDAGHTLTERLKPNDLTFARDTTDHGVETNTLLVAANLRPSQHLLLRSSSGFDFRRLDDESPDDYAQRKWLQWSTDLTYTPGKNWEHFLSNQVSHYPERTSSWQASTRYSGIHRTYLSTAFVYNRSAPSVVTWNQSVSYFFGPGWRVDAGLNALVPSQTFRQTRDTQLINTTLVLLRDMHCWQAQFIYRDTPPFSREFSFLLNLKLGGNAAKPIVNQDLEAQFYPWRNRGADPTIR